MSIYKFPKAITAAALFAVGVLALQGSADAQFGVNLPRDDFTWMWGDHEMQRRGSRDFSINGSEASFRCELTGSLRLGSRLSTGDIRQIENEIRTSLFFIQAAANMMAALDQRRELDWAMLDCAKPGEEDINSERAQQRLEKAREKAVREQAERRERREREEAKSAR